MKLVGTFPPLPDYGTGSDFPTLPVTSLPQGQGHHGRPPKAAATSVHRASLRTPEDTWRARVFARTCQREVVALTSIRADGRRAPRSVRHWYAREPSGLVLVVEFLRVGEQETGDRSQETVI